MPEHNQPARQRIQPGQRTVKERSQETGHHEVVRERPTKSEHKPRTVKGVAPVVVPGVVTTLAAYVKIEAKISASDEAEDTARRGGIRARHEFGAAILAEVPSNKKNLLKGRLSEICAKVGRGEREVQTRMALARLYPTEADLVALLDLGISWNEIKTTQLVQNPQPVLCEPPDEPPVVIGDRAAREARVAQITEEIVSAVSDSFEISPEEAGGTAFTETVNSIFSRVAKEMDPEALSAEVTRLADLMAVDFKAEANPQYKILTRVAAAIINTREALSLAVGNEDIAQAASTALASLEFLGQIVVKGAPDDGEDLGKALEGLLS